jgi:hypothetical protein
LYILIYKIFPKYIYFIRIKNTYMQPEAYFEVEVLEVSGELEPRRIPENPFPPLRRLGKRPYVAM